MSKAICPEGKICCHYSLYIPTYMHTAAHWVTNYDSSYFASWTTRETMTMRRCQRRSNDL